MKTLKRWLAVYRYLKYIDNKPKGHTCEPFQHSAAARMRLPAIYRDAKFRNITPTDGQFIGMAFCVGDGSVVRVAVPVKDAMEYAGDIYAQIAHAARKANKAGIPNNG
ncbi:MAG: hypothetical protein ACAH07_05925 [Methylophilaceae bacterium]|nr:hypothetical protein [Methyloradius sp.]